MNPPGKPLFERRGDSSARFIVQADETKAPEVISGLLSDILRLAYVMHAEAEKSAKPFEEWLKQFDGILDDNTWLAEVVATATSTFRRPAETD